ncbi:OsmC family protein [Zunongwangia sp.]|uniref:OsmC family protein n=1 Tax=Zunongwangia sp. TaxID=1965325 RepID=UPI003AA7CDB7
MTAKVKYLGNLRTEAEHLQSGTKLITDAPLDNHGKGESFSPTDTVATALASCILTMLGIKSESLGISIEGTTAGVAKTMSASPRRISKIDIELHFPEEYSEEIKTKLERVAKTCPVLYSLHPDIEKNIQFFYNK